VQFYLSDEVLTFRVDVVFNDVDGGQYIWS